MTRLDRVLKLLEDYDGLLETVIDQDIVLAVARLNLKELREEKEHLTQELIEHGCRRKN